MSINNIIITSDDRILVTGANGFIGSRVVETLLSYGFRNIRCFVRPSSDLTKLNKIIDSFPNGARVEIFTGTLTSQDDCIKATDGARIIYHLAAGTGKSFSGTGTSPHLSQYIIGIGAPQYLCLETSQSRIL